MQWTLAGHRSNRTAYLPEAASRSTLGKQHDGREEEAPVTGEVVWTIEQASAHMHFIKHSIGKHKRSGLTSMRRRDGPKARRKRQQETVPNCAWTTERRTCKISTTNPKQRRRTCEPEKDEPQPAATIEQRRPIGTEHGAAASWPPCWTKWIIDCNVYDEKFRKFSQLPSIWTQHSEIFETF